jgi:hypothetical protein
MVGGNFPHPHISHGSRHDGDAKEKTWMLLWRPGENNPDGRRRSRPRVTTQAGRRVCSDLEKMTPMAGPHASVSAGAQYRNGVIPRAHNPVYQVARVDVEPTSR